MAAALRIRIFQASWRPVVTLVVLVALMELAKRAHLLPVFVPAPSDVVWEVWKAPRIVTDNLVPTAWKAAAGYGIAACVAIMAASIAVSLRAFYGPITISA